MLRFGAGSGLERFRGQYKLVSIRWAGSKTRLMNGSPAASAGADALGERGMHDAGRNDARRCGEGFCTVASDVDLDHPSGIASGTIFEGGDAEDFKYGFGQRRTLRMGAARR